MHEWGKLCIRFAGCKLFSIHKSHSLYLDKCIYMSNHRDIYDFPIDSYLTGGSAMFISRYLIMFVFPLQFLITCIIKNTFYFKRGKIIDKTEFNSNIYKALCNSYYNNLIIYPEGTRRKENTLISIKKGSTHIAWKYNMAIQIIITKNKEHVINLKSLTSKYGVTLYCYYSEVIHPKYFSSFDEFNNYVSLIWADSWEKVYGPNEEEHSIEPLIVNPYTVKYSYGFYCFNIIFHVLIIGLTIYRFNYI
jgi:hypothetical protein